jgi:hypothetical protein
VLPRDDATSMHCPRSHTVSHSGPQMVPNPRGSRPGMIDSEREEGPLTWYFVQRQRARVGRDDRIRTCDPLTPRT